MISRPPIHTLFPYTTLFRSLHDLRAQRLVDGHELVDGRPTGVPGVEALVATLAERDSAAHLLGGEADLLELGGPFGRDRDRKSTRLNSSHGYISYAVFCLKK